MMNREFTNFLYNIELMPDWAYFQMNNDSIQNNYNKNKKNQQKEYRNKQIVKKEIQQSMNVMIQQSLKEIINGFNGKEIIIKI